MPNFCEKPRAHRVIQLAATDGDVAQMREVRRFDAISSIDASIAGLAGISVMRLARQNRAELPFAEEFCAERHPRARQRRQQQRAAKLIALENGIKPRMQSSRVTRKICRSDSRFDSRL